MPSVRDWFNALTGGGKDPDSYIQNVCNASISAPNDTAHKNTKCRLCMLERGHGRGGHPDPSKKHMCTCRHEWK